MLYKKLMIPENLNIFAFHCYFVYNFKKKLKFNITKQYEEILLRIINYFWFFYNNNDYTCPIYFMLISIVI